MFYLRRLVIIIIRL